MTTAVTVDPTALTPILAAGFLNSGVAVALGGLVVVIALVLVIAMLMRSSGSAQRTASGLGYDAQRGPLGQPRANGGEAAEWQPRQQAPAWQDNDLGAPAIPSQAPVGRAPAAWGQDAQYGAGAAAGPGRDAGFGAAGQPPAYGAGPAWGAQGGAAGQAAQNPWDEQANGGWGASASAGADEQWGAPAGGWNAAPQSRPMGAGQGMSQGMSQGGPNPWDAPAPSQPMARGANASPWGAPATPSAPAGAPRMPWEQPAEDELQWGAPPAAPAHQGYDAPQWGAPAAPPSQPGGWGGQDAGWGASAGSAAPAAPQGYANLEGGEEKTRVVRPGNQQRVGVIVVRQGKEPGRVYEARKDRLTIGRSRESDIFLEDLAVSRLHTTVTHDGGGRYIVHDENSANGTYVNGQRVTEQELEEGDEIQVGQTVLAFTRR